MDGRDIHVAVRVADLDLSALDMLDVASFRDGAQDAARPVAGTPDVADADTGAEDVEPGAAAVEPGTVNGAAAADAGVADDVLAAYVVRNITAFAGSTPCRAVSRPQSAAVGNGWWSVSWMLRCASAGATSLRVDLLFEELPSHLHFARVDVHGQPSVERLLTSTQRTWVVSATSDAAAAPRPQGSSLGSYVRLGVEHILSGYDHVAFLVALLLLARTLAEVAMLASSFTVAHSITLALAALGVVHPSAHAIEALIGFSIALVAIENGWLLSGRPPIVPAALALALAAMALAARRGLVSLSPLALAGLALFCVSHFSLMARVRDGTRLRVVVAFCFGLAHGFGFAGVLGEIASDPSRLVRGLLGFNAGVELGQLAIVALLWPLLVVAQRTRGGKPRLFIAEVGSAVVCALGTFWFLVRSLG